jgi:hypothetical protein
MTSILFIDANPYLDLFGLVSGRKLIDLLESQKANIFVPKQVADEVQRNKLRLANNFFSEQLKDIDAHKMTVPDHLLGIDEAQIREYRKALESVQKTKRDIQDLAARALAQISRSEDELSKRLASVFRNATPPTPEQLQRARERRERGNPPGKPSDPLGDQICWEQLLSACRAEKCKRFWIITRDKDYCVKAVNKVLLLNSALDQELEAACGTRPEIRCFDDLAVGLTEYARQAGANPETLPTPKEAEQIKKETETWIANTSAVGFEGMMSPRGIPAAIRFLILNQPPDDDPNKK